MLRWFAYPLGVAAIFGALIGLTMPVNLSAADRTGSAMGRLLHFGRRAAQHA